jgi:hypothetical protein
MPSLGFSSQFLLRAYGVLCVVLILQFILCYTIRQYH